MVILILLNGGVGEGIADAVIYFVSVDHSGLEDLL